MRGKSTYAEPSVQGKYARIGMYLLLELASRVSNTANMYCTREIFMYTSKVEAFYCLRPESWNIAMADEPLGHDAGGHSTNDI